MEVDPGIGVVIGDASQANVPPGRAPSPGCWKNAPIDSWIRYSTAVPFSTLLSTQR
jgi:hypothetical protein